jgi:ankyrin repeat protein
MAIGSVMYHIDQSNPGCGEIPKSVWQRDKELFKAVQRHDHKCIRELLSHGANPNARGNFGMTPLHLAVYMGDKEAAEILLDRGADPNIKDRAGGTPLHWAVAGGFPDLVELLLERGADPNARDNAGNTPLHIASMGHTNEVAETFFELAPRLGLEYPYDRLDTVRILLEYGADPTAKNNYGQTPIDLALKYQNDETAWLLASKLPPEKRKELLQNSKSPVATTAPATSAKKMNRRKKKIAA